MSEMVALKKIFLFVCFVKYPDGNFMMVSLFDLPRLESCGLDDLVATFKVELVFVLLEEKKKRLLPKETVAGSRV